VHEGDRVLKCAQNIVRTKGKEDGLCADGVPDNLVSRALTKAAAAGLYTGGKKPTPYNGYSFRVLKSQGRTLPEAPSMMCWTAR